MSNLPPYNHALCLKCGGADATTRYCEGLPEDEQESRRVAEARMLSFEEDPSWCYVRGEHHHRMCQTCGYAWKEAVWDPSQNAQPVRRLPIAIDSVGQAAVELLDTARALRDRDETSDGLATYYERLAYDLCVLQACLNGGHFVLEREEEPVVARRLAQMGGTVSVIRRLASHAVPMVIESWVSDA